METTDVYAMGIILASDGSLLTLPHHAAQFSYHTCVGKRKNRSESDIDCLLQYTKDRYQATIHSHYRAFSIQDWGTHQDDWRLYHFFLIEVEEAELTGLAKSNLTYDAIQQLHLRPAIVTQWLLDRLEDLKHLPQHSML